MCVPDLTIFTHDWVDGRDDEPMPNHEVKHACVDWDQLEDWTEKRRFSLSEGLIRRADGEYPATQNARSILTYHLSGTVWPDDLG